MSMTYGRYEMRDLGEARWFPFWTPELKAGVHPDGRELEASGIGDLNCGPVTISVHAWLTYVCGSWDTP